MDIKEILDQWQAKLETLKKDYPCSCCGSKGTHDQVEYTDNSVAGPCCTHCHFCAGTGVNLFKVIEDLGKKNEKLEADQKVLPGNEANSERHTTLAVKQALEKYDKCPDTCVFKKEI